MVNTPSPAACVGAFIMGVFMAKATDRANTPSRWSIWEWLFGKPVID
jgi:hypothetical protein